MKGFILAAGFGTRLAPLSEESPKPLAPIATVPAIHYAIHLLAQAGITEIFINLHYQGQQIEQALGNGSQFGVSITYSHEEEILGTGGGIRKIAPLLESNDLVVVNSDVLFDLNLQEVIDFHHEKDALATMVLRHDAKQAQYGLIEIDEHGSIKRFLGEEAPHYNSESSALKKYMFSGVHILHKRFLEYIPPDINTCINRYAYPKAMRNEEALFGFVSDRTWRDIGSIPGYFNTNMEVLDRQVQFEYLDPLSMFTHTPKKEVDSIIRLGKNAVLGEGVLLQPPVLVADGAKILDNAIVGPYAIVGPGATVGKGTKLSRCIVIKDAKVPANKTIQNHIISKDHSINVDES